MTHDRDYPRVRQVPADRLWAFAWAAIFFTLINIVVFIAFLPVQSAPFQRLSFQTSHEELLDVLGRIRRDNRPKVVFIGSSVLIGTSIPNPDDTIPAVFGRMLNADSSKEVAVYNLGIPSSRPLDAILLTLLLKDSSTLIIQDFNHWSAAPVDTVRLLQESSSYVRMSTLYRENAAMLYREIPATRACFAARQIPLIDEQPLSIGGLGGVFGWLPVVHYKDALNIRLFGQHPLTLAEHLLLQLARLRHGEHFAWRDLFLPPEQVVVSTAWQADDHRYDEFAVEPAFSPDELSNCLVKAFAGYVAEHKLPVVTYEFPNNPGIVHQQNNAVHRRNTALILDLFSGTRVLSFDDGSFPSSHFTDLHHLTPDGVKAFVPILFQALRPDLQSAGLLP